MELLDVVLICWTHMSFPNRLEFNEVITALYDFSTTGMDASSQGDRLSRVVSALGLATLQVRFIELLQVSSTYSY